MPHGPALRAGSRSIGLQNQLARTRAGWRPLRVRSSWGAQRAAVAREVSRAVFEASSTVLVELGSHPRGHLGGQTDAHETNADLVRPVHVQSQAPVLPLPPLLLPGLPGSARCQGTSISARSPRWVMLFGPCALLVLRALIGCRELAPVSGWCELED